jgi:hypothetical protein
VSSTNTAVRRTSLLNIPETAKCKYKSSFIHIFHSWPKWQVTLSYKEIGYIWICYFGSNDNRMNEGTVPYLQTPDCKFLLPLCGSWLVQPSSLSWHTE